MCLVQKVFNLAWPVGNRIIYIAAKDLKPVYRDLPDPLSSEALITCIACSCKLLFESCISIYDNKAVESFCKLIFRSPGFK